MYAHVYPMTLAHEARNFSNFSFPSWYTFADMYIALKCRFNLSTIAFYTRVFRQTTYRQIKALDPKQTPLETLERLIDELRYAKLALGPDYAGDIHLYHALTAALRGIPRYRPAFDHETFNADYLIDDLRSLAMSILPIPDF